MKLTHLRTLQVHEVIADLEKHSNEIDKWNVVADYHKLLAEFRC